MLLFALIQLNTKIANSYFYRFISIGNCDALFSHPRICYRIILTQKILQNNIPLLFTKLKEFWTDKNWIKDTFTYSTGLKFIL